MKNHFYFILIFLIQINGFTRTPLTSKDFGIWAGDGYYLGELNQNHYVPFNLAGGLYYRYNYDDRLGIRGSLNYGKIEGKDANSNNSFNKARNLSFSSQIFELAVLGEFNFVNFSYLNVKAKKISPYVFMGLGMFYNLHSEKFIEGNSYSNVQAAIPMGIGIKYGFGRYGIAMEWGARKTFTDYLDGVSTYYPKTERNLANFQRGEEFNNDWIIYTGLSFFVNLTPKRMCPN